MGTGIDLFLDWENGIWVAGKKYNFDPFLVSLVMIFVVNYIIHSTTCKQAYSGGQNSGFSDYACLRMLQMPFPGFKLKNFPCLWHEPPPPQYFIKCPPLAHTVT
jgi:ribose/xylose/arabinose/galactoside ABC-type transport system permease subunit